ncbi:hypothetical protein [Peijinzhouia sedimentorum]
MDLSDIGNISSIAGLIISIVTLIIAYIVSNEVKRIQFSNLFDRRITKYLTDIDKLQSELISNISDVKTNEIRIKEILVKELAAFESLLPKLSDKNARQKTVKIIAKIEKLKNHDFYQTNIESPTVCDRIVFQYKFFVSNMSTNKRLLNLYILINENYNRIEEVKLDKKALIK